MSEPQGLRVEATWCLGRAVANVLTKSVADSRQDPWGQEKPSWTAPWCHRYVLPGQGGDGNLGVHLCEVGDSEEYVLHSKADVVVEVCAMACSAPGVWRTKPAGRGGLVVEPVSKYYCSLHRVLYSKTGERNKVG